jgi:hypothetical protein
MWKYVKAAFTWESKLPWIEQFFPTNIVLLLVGTVVGCGFHPLWLLTAGLEAVYLFLMVSDKRFRNVVDGRQSLSTKKDAERARLELTETLPLASKRRLEATEIKYNRVIALYRKNTDSYVVAGNVEALSRLMTMYVKLLLSLKATTDAIELSEKDNLEHKLKQLRVDVTERGLSDAARASKQKTLDLTTKRWETYQQRKQQVTEISSDLERIESEIDLALENASAPSAINAGGIDLISDMISMDTDGDGRADQQQAELYPTHI